MIVCGTSPQIENGKKGSSRHQYGREHPAGSGGAYQYAVPKKSAETDQGNGKHPVEIILRNTDDFPVVRQQPQKTFSPYPIQGGE